MRGGALMEARYNAMIAAKSHFFTLKDIYPKVSTQVMAFTKADKAEKAKLLPTIRQQVETWLNSFSLLLDTDKAILLKNNEQISKIAAQLKITAANKIQQLPPAYEEARDIFLADFNKLNAKKIAIFSAGKEEQEAITLLLTQQNFANKKGIRGIMMELKKDANLSEDSRKKMAEDYNQKIEPCFKQLGIYNQLLKPENNPFVELKDEGKTQKAYNRLTNTVFDNEPLLEQEVKRAEERLKEEPNNRQIQIWLERASEKLKVLKAYKKNLLEFTAYNDFTITSNIEATQEDFDGYIRQNTLSNGKVGLEVMVNQSKLDGLNFEDRQNVKDRIIAHEMQHAIQFQEGRLAYRTDKEGNPHRLFYDLTDEVEAFKAEYALYGKDPRSKSTLRGVTEITDITTDLLADNYPELKVLNMNLNLSSTVEFLKANNFIEFNRFIAGIESAKEPIFRFSSKANLANLELRLTTTTGWQEVGTLSFRGFLQVLLKNHPSVNLGFTYK